MRDPIERQDAIDVLKERLYANGYSDVKLVSELNRSIGYIMRLPSAQPERKGHWIEVAGDLQCSECGRTYYDLYPDYSETHFCPNCGADMREDQDGESD